MIARQYFALTFIAALIAAGPAHAYIGPGAGLGAIAVIVAIGLGVVLLIAGLAWYPLKRLLKARKGGGEQGK